MSPDIEKYRKRLEQYCLSKDVEEQLIHSYWSAIERLVDRELQAIDRALAITSDAAKDSLDALRLVHSPQRKSPDTEKEAP